MANNSPWALPDRDGGMRRTKNTRLQLQNRPRQPGQGGKRSPAPQNPSSCAIRSPTRLGYKTWADYVIEIKMAKTAARAQDFLEKLKAGFAAQV